MVAGVAYDSVGVGSALSSLTNVGVGETLPPTSPLNCVVSESGGVGIVFAMVVMSEAAGSVVKGDCSGGERWLVAYCGTPTGGVASPGRFAISDCPSWVESGGK